MKNFLKILTIIFAFVGISTKAAAVEQRYMPDGYIEDAKLTPHYKNLMNEYFQKAEKGEVQFSWSSYYRYVETPLSKINTQLIKDARKEQYP